MSEVEAVEGLVLASQAKPVQFDAPEGRTFIAVPTPEGGFKLEQITSPNKADVLMPKIVTVNYQKEQDAMSKGSIALPQSIMLSIPVYFGEPAVAVMAYMRRQIDDGKLKLGVQLSRAENVRQEEFHRVVDWITDEVEGLTTVYGTPG